MKIALVTANFGGIDMVKPLPPRMGIDAFCFTDSATLEATDPSVSRTWTTIAVPDTDTLPGARLRSRYFKHQIHRLPQTQACRWLVWADSSIAFKELAFIPDIVRTLQGLAPAQRLLLIPHPDRESVRQEIAFVESQLSQGNEYLCVRYGSDRIAQGKEHLLSRGFSLDAKLWCGGFWVIENNPILHQAWDAWWSYTLRFGMQDQFYLPAALAECGLMPQPANFALRHNPHFDLVKHVSLV